jgi:hypothetical protein
MARLLVAILLVLSTTAAATVTSLFEPHARVDESFPPLQVLVTDASGLPVAGANVAWVLPWGGFSSLLDVPLGTASGCTYDLGYACFGMSDAHGVAELPGVHGHVAGTFQIGVSATDANHQSLGGLQLTVVVEPGIPTASLSVVSGDGQRAIAGTTLANPFVVRALDAAGRPLVGAHVLFSVFNSFEGSFDASRSDAIWYEAITDPSGYATSPRLVVGLEYGYHSAVVELFDPAAHKLVRTALGFGITNAQGGVLAPVQDMWWSGSSENGWGMSIVQHVDQLFAVIYAYDDQGEPTWWAMPDGQWLHGVQGAYTGRLFSPRSTPYYAYQASGLNVGETPSNFASLAFFELTLSRGFLSGHIGDFDLGKPLVRQQFSSEKSGIARGVGDMWWGGPSQNGWGIAMIEHGDALFAVWLTYGDDGKPTWFVMPEGEWNGSVYSGSMYRTRGAPIVGKPYDASRFAIAQSGTFKLDFSGTDHATFQYSIAGHSGTLPIERQPF